jgi:hypothetical protein
MYMQGKAILHDQWVASHGDCGTASTRHHVRGTVTISGSGRRTRAVLEHTTLNRMQGPADVCCGICN